MENSHSVRSLWRYGSTARSGRGVSICRRDSCSGEEIERARSGDAQKMRCAVLVLFLAVLGEAAALVTPPVSQAPRTSRAPGMLRGGGDCRPEERVDERNLSPYMSASQRYARLEAPATIPARAAAMLRRLRDRYVRSGAVSAREQDAAATRPCNALLHWHLELRQT